jgi:hypothetical protein
MLDVRAGPQLQTPWLWKTGNLLIDAQTAFARQRRGRRRDRAADWLRRRAGLEAIPLESIVGTAEPTKSREFDRRFRPRDSSRHRWERLWMAGRRGARLPPISVFRVGERHFVDDGHHRVSVANALGMVAIDAEVTELT